MKKLILVSILALGSFVSFAGNTEKCISMSPCEQVFRTYHTITVREWYFPGGGVFPIDTAIYTESGWFTAAELESRKTYLKSQYPDNLVNGVGSKYVVISSPATKIGDL